MKKILQYLSLAAILPLVMSCSVTKRMERSQPLEVVPATQKLVANQNTEPYTVNAAYKVNIPPRYVPKKAQVVVTSQLVNGSNEQLLSNIYINGKKYERMMLRQAKSNNNELAYPLGMVVVSGKEPMTVAVDEAVAFQPWMQNSKLIMTTSVNTKRLPSTQIDSRVLATGVAYTPPAPAPKPAPIPEPKPTFKKETGMIQLRYMVGSAKIDPKMGDNKAELDKMVALLNNVVNDKMYKTDHITIIGSCSPEGPYPYNAKLAQSRAQSIDEYVAKMMSLDSNMIKIETIPENWDMLRTLVQESTFSNKEQILKIIDSDMSPEAKDAVMRRLPNYSTIKAQLYPQLRYVDYEVYYTKEIPAK